MLEHYSQLHTGNTEECYNYASCKDLKKGKHIKQTYKFQCCIDLNKCTLEYKAYPIKTKKWYKRPGSEK